MESGFGEPCVSAAALAAVMLADGGEAAEAVFLPAAWAGDLRPEQRELLHAMWVDDPEAADRALSAVGPMEPPVVEHLLVAAATADSARALRLLLTRSDVPSTSAILGPALLQAGSCGSARVAQTLLEAGAEPGYRRDGGDAMMFALLSGHPQLATLLLDAGYDVCGQEPRHRETIARLAAERGLAPLVQGARTCGPEP